MKKIILVITTFLFAGLLHAQDSTSFAFTFDHAALSVKDVNRSAEFYKTVLKLPEIENRTRKEGIRWFSLGGGKELHLVSIIKDPVVINKAVHIALTTKNFDAFVKILIGLKIAYSDWPGTPNTITIRADGIKQLYFQDPDGYWIEINSVAG
jgi:lactoylglutathione lyase